MKLFSTSFAFFMVLIFGLGQLQAQDPDQIITKLNDIFKDDSKANYNWSYSPEKHALVVKYKNNEGTNCGLATSLKITDVSLSCVVGYCDVVLKSKMPKKYMKVRCAGGTAENTSTENIRLNNVAKASEAEALIRQLINYKPAKESNDFDWRKELASINTILNNASRMFDIIRVEIDTNKDVMNFYSENGLTSSASLNKIYITVEDDLRGDPAIFLKCKEKECVYKPSVDIRYSELAITFFMNKISKKEIEDMAETLKKVIKASLEE